MSSVHSRGDEPSPSTYLPAPGSSASHPPGHEPGPPVAPGRHVLGALVITLIVTGIAFLITDELTKWIVVAVAVIMDLSVLAFGAVDALSRRRARTAR